MTKGNLSETTSSVLTISGGTSAVLGSGVTIEVAQSGSAQSGYLSSADWSTFNAKQDALPPQTTADTVLAYDGSALTWQYAGKGGGGYPNDVIIVGRPKPVNLTGTSNTIIGGQAGTDLTTANANCLFGALAGRSLTSGGSNNFYGNQAGR